MTFIHKILLLIMYINIIIAQDKRPSVAVLDFDAKGIPTYEAETLTERLRSEIANTNAVRLTDRKLLEKILQEQGLQQSGCTTDECAAEVGQLLNHQIISDDQSIYFDLEHFKKNDIIIYLSYLFLNQDNEPISSGSSELIVSPVPDEFALHQNYPNPFNPVTTINYDLPEESYVNLFIYDILGREVANLVGNVKPAGYQSVTWNTNNILGVPVSAGIYFYQIQTNKYVKTRKMVILK